MVVVDDLCELGEGAGDLLERRVIGAVPMKHHDGRALPHGLAVRYELRAIDVDEEPNIADGNQHRSRR